MQTKTNLKLLPACLFNWKENQGPSPIPSQADLPRTNQVKVIEEVDIADSDIVTHRMWPASIKLFTVKLSSHTTTGGEQ